MTDNNGYSLALLPIIAGLFMLFALSGCSTVFKPVNTQIHIPEDKFECGLVIERPQGPKIMESQTAKYISNLEYSDQDCKITNKEIKIIIECFNDKDCKIDNLIKYMGLVKDAKAR